MLANTILALGKAEAGGPLLSSGQSETHRVKLDLKTTKVNLGSGLTLALTST